MPKYKVYIREVGQSPSIEVEADIVHVADNNRLTFKNSKRDSDLKETVMCFHPDVWFQFELLPQDNAEGSPEGGSLHEKQSAKELREQLGGQIRLLLHSAEYIDAANAEINVVTRTTKLPCYETLVTGLKSWAQELQRRRVHEDDLFKKRK